MTHLYEVVSHDELLQGLLDGYIREQTHPDHPHYRILNYTEKAQYERKWNDTIRTCRGLIYNAETWEVLARPFPKIHNWDEQEAPNIAWDQVLYHWDNKYDGSLGILYRDPNGRPAIATRGSFASEQAIRGTQMLHGSGKAWVFDEWIESGYTPLFEIIYPENRIVLKYDEEFLQPLGLMHIDTGLYVPPTRSAEQRTFGSLATDLSRENAEGWVVWSSPLTAVKIKQPDYVELHRAVTGLNRKVVWRAVSEGPHKVGELIEALPDEFHDYVRHTAKEIQDAYGTRVRGIDAMYVDVLHEPEMWSMHGDGEQHIDRPKFAAAAKRIAGRDASYMFSLLDGKDIQSKVWAELEPKGGEL